MMATAETAVTDTILAIDPGKYKSVTCLSRSTATDGLAQPAICN
jgi:hypothetical protein